MNILHIIVLLAALMPSKFYCMKNAFNHFSYNNSPSDSLLKVFEIDKIQAKLSEFKISPEANKNQLVDLPLSSPILFSLSDDGHIGGLKKHFVLMQKYNKTTEKYNNIIEVLKIYLNDGWEYRQKKKIQPLTQAYTEQITLNLCMEHKSLKEELDQLTIYLLIQQKANKKPKILFLVRILFLIQINKNYL